MRLVIAFTPGSSTDIIGRVVAAKLQEMWGQPVVGENRVGAGGSIGSKVVVDSAPDGYTLLANSSAHVANPGIYAKLPYDTLKDFTNLALLGGGPNVLITSPESGLKSLKDFVAAAKANPGKLNFASAGIGSGTHFNIEKLKIAAGHRRHARAVQGHARGDRRHHRQPHLLLLGAAQRRAAARARAARPWRWRSRARPRSPLLPNVPTVAEQGYPGFDYTLWVGLWGPANMPADLAAKINKDVNAALASPDVRERLTKLGTVPGNMTIPEFTAFVRKEVDETQKILQAAGIKPQ